MRRQTSWTLSEEERRLWTSRGRLASFAFASSPSGRWEGSSSGPTGAHYSFRYDKMRFTPGIGLRCAISIALDHAPDPVESLSALTAAGFYWPPAKPLGRYPPCCPLFHERGKASQEKEKRTQGRDYDLLAIRSRAVDGLMCGNFNIHFVIMAFQQPH